jgi:chaperone required for assembly of F1-ATPase
MKRVYETVTLGPGGEGEQAPPYLVLLDGRPLRTPAKARLALPDRQLAEAIAGEWRAQGETIAPRNMPLTALACTALDRVAGKRGEIVDELLRFGGHDLLCYRAESPDDLVSRQRALWDPLLDWAAEALGAELVVTGGIVAVDQPAAALTALEREIAPLDDFRLAALGLAVTSSGSLVIGLALILGRIEAAEAFAAAALDEDYALERRGEDRLARERLQAVRRDLEAAARVARLLAQA